MSKNTVITIGGETFEGLKQLNEHGVKKKGIADKENLMDHMNATELVANQFRMTQTRDKLACENTHNQQHAIETHQQVGKEVRDAIKRIGGTLPEPAITCTNCEACCCRLEVLLITETGVPERYIKTDQWGGQTMLRLADGWCAALDRNTHMCTIYEKRPLICREFTEGEPDCIDQRALYL